MEKAPQTKKYFFYREANILRTITSRVQWIQSKQMSVTNQTPLSQTFRITFKDVILNTLYTKILYDSCWLRMKVKGALHIECFPENLRAHSEEHGENFIRVPIISESDAKEGGQRKSVLGNIKEKKMKIFTARKSK